MKEITVNYHQVDHHPIGMCLFVRMVFLIAKIPIPMMMNRSSRRYRDDSPYGSPYNSRRERASPIYKRYSRSRSRSYESECLCLN